MGAVLEEMVDIMACIVVEVELEGRASLIIIQTQILQCQMACEQAMVKF